MKNRWLQRINSPLKCQEKLDKMKRLKKSNRELNKRMQAKTAKLDIPELKYWWAKIVKKSLPFYEMEDGSLDLEKVDHDCFDVWSRLEHFQEPSTEDLQDLINSYFIRPWGLNEPYESHEEVRSRIQLSYLNNKKSLMKFIESYVEPLENPVKDLIAFFKLNEIESDILYYTFCDAYVGAFFVLSQNESSSISEDIEIITKHPRSEISKYLTGESTLISEKIISIYNDRYILFNTAWDEFIFKGEVTNRRKLFYFHSRLSHDDLKRMRRKRIENIDDTDLPPFDYFLKIKSIKTVYSYPEHIDSMVTFSYLPFDKTGFSASPIKVIVEKHGISFMSRQIDYKTAPNDQGKIIEGELIVYFRGEDFKIIINELKNNFPEYYSSELAPLLKTK